MAVSLYSQKLAQSILKLHDPDPNVFKDRLLKFMDLEAPKKTVAEKKPTPSKVASKAPTKASKAPTKKSSAPEKIVTEANDWENQEALGFVFLTLEAGIGGSKVEIAVGRQDETSEEVGIGSITPLEESDIEEALEKSIPVLTPSAASVLKRKNLKKYKELEKYDLV